MADPFNQHADQRNAGVRSPSPNRTEEAQLWTSYRSGNREALNTIFEKYVRMLVRYGSRMTPDEELVADCIQDVFVELWVKRKSIAARIDSIKYYLFRSVRRRLIRKLSIEKRLAGLSVDDSDEAEADFNIESHLIRKQTLQNVSLQLNAALSTLSKPQREAVYLKFYEGMSYEQIANVMNTDVKAVYNLIARSVASLRKFFKNRRFVV